MFLVGNVPLSRASSSDVCSANVFLGGLLGVDVDGRLRVFCVCSRDML